MGRLLEVRGQAQASFACNRHVGCSTEARVLLSRDRSPRTPTLVLSGGSDHGAEAAGEGSMELGEVSHFAQTRQRNAVTLLVSTLQ